MKKIISILLTVCLCASCAAILTACDEDHEHVFKTEWAKDATHHWHECEGDNCLAFSDKAEHTWNEGEITTDATADAEGEKTFTCTVCGATKGESVEFVGITEEIWQESLAEQKFDNVTVHYSFKTPEMTQNHIVKIANDEVYREATMIGDGFDYTDSVFYTGEEGILQRDMFLSVFLALLADRDHYVYDSETGLYLSPNEVTTTLPMDEDNIYAKEVMTNGKAKFDSTGKLEEFSCSLTESIYKNDVLEGEVSGEVVWTFSDYGTTVIDASEKQN